MKVNKFTRRYLYPDLEVGCRPPLAALAPQHSPRPIRAEDIWLVPTHHHGLAHRGGVQRQAVASHPAWPHGR